MKNLLLFCCSAFLLVGCNSEELQNDFDNIAPTENSTKYSISQIEGLEIANKILKRSNVRNAEDIDFDYIVTEATRGAENTDTLAYIYNYPNASGFAVISSSNNRNPLLAFSEVGRFDKENISVHENFIKHIYSYLHDDSFALTRSNDIPDLETCVFIEPFSKGHLHQSHPWNKYVVTPENNYVVGCVGIATALTMCYTKSHLKYHDEMFYFASIIQAIDKEAEKASNENPSQNQSKRIVNGDGPVFISYTYDQAVDLMAKLLYWIGKDLKFTYGENSTSGYSSKVDSYLRNMGFSIKTPYSEYNFDNVMRAIGNNYMVYLVGRTLDNKSGHAWIADGGYYCYEVFNPSNISSGYIHCDWGWGGISNGYYNGDVFDSKYGSFKMNYYFAVEREWK